MSANRVRGILKIPVEDGLQDEMMQKMHLSPEAQCIIYILRKLISNVETAAILPAILRLNDRSSVADRELSRALQKHQVLEERLEKHESEGKYVTAELKEDVKDSFRNLLRLFQGNSDLISAWKKALEKEMGLTEKALVKGLHRLHDCIVERFRDTDQALQLRASKQLSASSNLKVEDDTSLQEFASTMKEIDAKISQKEQQIKPLEGSLQEKRQEASALETQHQSIIEESQATLTTLQQEIHQINSQLDNLIISNRHTESELQQKIDKVEAVTDILIQEFDEEIGALQANLELNEREYEMESEEMKKLEMQISELDVEYKDILERQRLAAEKMKEEEKELELKTKAALLAQAWWRGYCVRKEMTEKSREKAKEKERKPSEADSLLQT